MLFKIPHLKAILALSLFVLVLIFTRFYNLDKTARFIWDESSDLVNMHQIYVEKKITLVGPISEDGSKVFSSITYYMLLPFAIVGKFDPVSPAYGAAFWGLVTGLLIIYLGYKVNKKNLGLFVPLVLFWYPLAETGRWAWNPNLIPLWITLSIIFFLQKSTFSKFVSGFFIGLAIHQHYLAIFAVIGLGLMILFESIRDKKLKNFFIFSVGVIVTILPFIFFDLTHPPGLFLSRILYFNNFDERVSFIQSLLTVINGTFLYFTQNAILEIFLIAANILLLFNDIKRKSNALTFYIIFVIQLIGIVFVSNFYTHYILPALPFFIIYLIYPRYGVGKMFSYLAILILLISSVISFPKQIFNVTWQSDITSTRYIANTISKKITSIGMKNVNIAVLGSSDTNTYGRRYRDLLLIKNIPLKTKGEYEISDSLFVISTQTLENLRNDPAYEIKYFKNGPLVEEWNVPGRIWKIYLLSKSTLPFYQKSLVPISPKISQNHKLF